MGDENPASSDHVKEIAALKVSLILEQDQREQELAAGRTDLVAKREVKIASLKQRLKELGEDV